MHEVRNKKGTPDVDCQPATFTQDNLHRANVSVSWFLLKPFFAGFPFRYWLCRGEPWRGLDRYRGHPGWNHFFREKFHKNKFWVSANILFIVFLFWNLSLPEFYVGEHLKCGFLGCGWLVQPDAKPVEEPKQNTMRGLGNRLLVLLTDNQWWNSH